MANESGKGQKRKTNTAKKTGNGARPPKGGRRRPRDTFPYVEVAVTFSHPVVHKAYERFFDRYRQCYFHITASLQKARVDQSLDLVYDHLADQIDEAEGALNQAAKELKALIEAELGDQEITTKISKKERVTAKVPGNLCRRYLNLFPLLDRYIDEVIFAETMGVITHSKKRELMKNCPRYVTTVAGRFQSLCHGVDVHNRSKDQVMASVREAIEAHLAMKPIAKQRPLKAKSERKGQALNGGAETLSASEAWGG